MLCIRAVRVSGSFSFQTWDLNASNISKRFGRSGNMTMLEGCQSFVSNSCYPLGQLPFNLDRPDKAGGLRKPTFKIQPTNLSTIACRCDHSCRPALPLHFQLPPTNLSVGESQAGGRGSLILLSLGRHMSYCLNS